MPDTWFPVPIPAGAAASGNAAGATITGWGGLSWVFEKLPDYKCRVTINGTLTLTTAGTAGQLYYNVFFLPANFTQSVGGMPPFLLPAALPLTSGANPGVSTQTMNQPASTQYFLDDIWNVGISQGGGVTGGFYFLFSAFCTTTAAAGVSLTLNNVTLIYKTVNQSAI